MTKKLPVVRAARRELGAARLAQLKLHPNLSLAEMQAAISDGLMAFSCATGLLVLAEMMEAERSAIAAPKGKHDPNRVAERNWLLGN